MLRRSFVLALASTGIATRLRAQSAPAAAQPRPERLIMDAMGELRLEYPPALIREMLASGMDAITITLSDPKLEGAAALELAVDELLAYDRFIAAHPTMLMRAISVADLDRARREGKLAVFYLFQNTIQFGTDLDRVDLFYRMGLGRLSSPTTPEITSASAATRREASPRSDMRWSRG